MKMKSCKLFALATVAIMGAFAGSTPAAAQLQYGPWQKTSDCRTIRVPVGPGGGNVEVPQITVPGQERAMECKWERQVTECPRIRDRLMHPIQCITKRQRSCYSVSRPSN